MCIGLPSPIFAEPDSLGYADWSPKKLRKSALCLPHGSNNRTGWGTHPQNAIFRIFSRLAGVCQEFWIPHVLKMRCRRAVPAMAGLRSHQDKIKDLDILSGLIESKKVRVILERCFPMDQMVAAHRYVEQGKKYGNVVVEFIPGG